MSQIIQRKNNERSFSNDHHTGADSVHWNGNVIILTKFSSLAALKVVILTTFGAASDENFIKMMTFSFQWYRDVVLPV